MTNAAFEGDLLYSLEDMEDEVERFASTSSVTPQSTRNVPSASPGIQRASLCSTRRASASTVNPA